MSSRAAVSASTPDPAGQHRATPAEIRAARLLRWYPAGWRARYGEEFAELLVADLSERPKSLWRTADVARSGLRTRLAAAGLASHPLDPAAAAGAGLAALAWSVGLFLVVGTAISSQLGIGLQWAPASTPGITLAMALMSASLLVCAALAVLAAIPLACAVIRMFRRGMAAPLRWPALLIVASATILVIGGRHFENGWPGTGGHWWPANGLVPAGLAAFGWSATMSVTAYWAHPSALAAFPASELAWMALSPVAVLGLLTGAGQLLRRVDHSGRAIRYMRWIGRAAGAAMTVFVGGAAGWLLTAGGQPQRLLQTGSIDAAALAALAVALLAGARATEAATTAAGSGTMPAGGR